MVYLGEKIRKDKEKETKAMRWCGPAGRGRQRERSCCRGSKQSPNNREEPQVFIHVVHNVDQ